MVKGCWWVVSCYHAPIVTSARAHLQCRWAQQGSVRDCYAIDRMLGRGIGLTTGKHDRGMMAVLRHGPRGIGLVSGVHMCAWANCNNGARRDASTRRVQTRS